MTYLAIALLAAFTLGQQAEPLVGQTELPPPGSAKQPAATVGVEQPSGQPPAQVAQQEEQKEESPPALPPPVERATDPEAKKDTRQSSGKRVVAFWVLLPGKDGR